jgi:holin-like protein
MRRLVGIAWLWAFLALGNFLGGVLAVSVPGSVIGMVLLWAALETRLVRLAWLDEGAGTLLGALGLLFVPAGVGFVQFVHAGTVWFAAAAILGVGTLITLAVTGHVAQQSLRHG